MTPDKNFRLAKTIKREMALMPAEARSHFKKMMIQAQLHEEKARRESLKSNDKSDKSD